MVITRIRFSIRKSRSVNDFLWRLDLGLQKSARCQKTEENQVPIQGKTEHSGNLVFSGPVPEPGTKGLMTTSIYTYIYIYIWPYRRYGGGGKMHIHVFPSFSLSVSLSLSR